MGKTIMDQKKILSTIIIGILLASVATVIVPVTKAENASMHTIYGKVYINGILAPDGVQIHISCSEPAYDNTVPTSLQLSGDNLEISFQVSDGFTTGKTIYFNLIYRSLQYSVLLKEAGDVGSIALYFLDLNYTNVPPNPPSNPIPTNGASGVGIDADLSWTCSDPDGDPVTYDIYFGTTNPPTTKVSSSQSGTTYDPGTMSYSTPYYWQIIAWDNYGLSTAGPIWSFTTQSSGGGGGGSTSTNKAPTAEANGPYNGFVGQVITFDGSGSTDTDGTIAGYRWDFTNDGTYDTGWLTTPTTTYTFTAKGTYTVRLQVKDDDGATGTDTATVTILTANNPPTKPIVTGPITGHKNTVYDYTAVSTDADNDTIQYIFTWDDGTNTTTVFLANGTMTTQNHSWAAAGRYILEVYAYDNSAPSETTMKTVFIDTLAVDDIGYLIDTNGDGIYDLFHNDTTGNETVVQQQDGNYLIDTNGDGVFDKTFNPDTGGLTDYNQGAPSSAGDNTANTIFLGIIIFIIVLLLIMFAITRKKKDKTSEKPPETTEPPVEEKTTKKKGSGKKPKE